MSEGDQVHLVLPAVAAYGRVARITAAHLALRRGFSLAEIDDLRLVMDEAAAMMLERSRLAMHGEGQLDLLFDIARDTISISATLIPDAEPADPALADPVPFDSALEAEPESTPTVGDTPMATLAALTPTDPDRVEPQLPQYSVDAFTSRVGELVDSFSVQPVAGKLHLSKSKV